MSQKDKIYYIHSTAQLLRDAASIKFHVENNDYFGTAATIISLIRQQLTEQIKSAPAKDRRLLEKTFKNLETDLMMLQANYHIRANRKKIQSADKGKLKSQ